MHNLHLYVTWANSHEDAVKRAEKFFNSRIECSLMDYFAPFEVLRKGDSQSKIVNSYAKERYQFFKLEEDYLKNEYRDFFENTPLIKFLHIYRESQLTKYKKSFDEIMKSILIYDNAAEFLNNVNKNDVSFKAYGLKDFFNNIELLVESDIVENGYDFWISTYAYGKITTPLGLSNDTIYEDAKTGEEKYIVAVDVHF